MSDFEPSRDAGYLDLYRPDGRYFDIRENDGVLSLELRRSVRVDRSIIAGITAAGWIGIYGLMVWLNWDSPDFSDVMSLTNSLGLMLPLQLGWGYIAAMKRGIVWKFDKSSAEVRVNATKIVDFSKIKSVRAWRRGSRFCLTLQGRYGQTVKIGRLGFGRSEYAWRRDAAQIAAFLGVPLEIPPL